MFKKIRDFFILKEGGGVKPKDATASIWKSLYRRPGVFIAKKLVNTKITPNQITFLSFLMKFPSAYFFYLGDYRFVVIGAIIFYLSIVVDFIDGPLARLKNKTSDYGAWLDFGTDEFGNVIVLFAICLGLYLKLENIWVWIFGFLAVGSILSVTMVYQTFVRFFPEGDSKVIETQKKKTKFLKQFFYNDPFFNTTLIIAGLTNLLYPFIIMCAIYGWLFTIAMFIGLSIKVRNI